MQFILRNGANGIMSQMQKMDTIANNMANVNTNSFKSQDTAFSSLVQNRLSSTTTPVNNEERELTTGSGSRVAATWRDFSPGQIVKSTGDYKMAINGKGFFRVVDGQGNEFYTRDGNFQKDSQGRLVNSSGYYLPGIEIEGNPESVSINPGGSVEITGESGETENAGQINVYTFADPQGLEARGENLFIATESSGEARELVPGNEDAGELKQGFLEKSNTDVTREMTELIETQRSTQMNARSIRIADELWNLAINMRK